MTNVKVKGDVTVEGGELDHGDIVGHPWPDSRDDLAGAGVPNLHFGLVAENVIGER